MRRRSGNYVLALFLIVLGGWLMADSLGVRLPGLAQLWPIFPTVIGLAMLMQSAGSSPHDEGLVFVGVASLLTGAFLFLFTLGVLSWREMFVYWPAFPLIGGASFFALYLAGGMRDQTLLVPAFAAGGVGVIALPFILGAVGNTFLNQAVRLWPVLVVILGLAFLFRPARRVDEPRVGGPPADESGGDAAE